MRIIAGTAKGTRLHGLQGLTLRPTLDRVRESLFSQIAPDLPGSRFLDLFAGTGAIGLEALSRGAAAVVFVEPDRRIRELLEKNVARCRFGEDRIRVLPREALLALRLLEKEARAFDWIYVDPPFEAGLYEPVLSALADSCLVAATSLVLVEHHRKQALAANYGKLVSVKNRRLGDTQITFYGV